MFCSGEAVVLFVNVHNYKVGSTEFIDREGQDVTGWRSIYASGTYAGGVKTEYSDVKVR